MIDARRRTFELQRFLAVQEPEPAPRAAARDVAPAPARLALTYRAPGVWLEVRASPAKRPVARVAAPSAAWCYRRAAFLAD